MLGARVLGEFGDDPERYDTAKSRRNYAGTSPLTIASGKKRAVLARHVRNRRLYDAIDQWAFCSPHTSPGCRTFYDQRRAAGDLHHQALRALGNRLVGYLHGCLRTHTHYNEHTAWAHRQPQEPDRCLTSYDPGVSRSLPTSALRRGYRRRLMHPVYVLGRGWLATEAIRAARIMGISVESIDRSRRPDLFPPASHVALAGFVGEAVAVINACGRLRGDDRELQAANVDLARFVARAAAVTSTRLVHVGSAAEYGPPTTERLHEDHPTRPAGPYGRTKLHGTRAVLDVSEQGGAVVARVFNPVGPGQPDHLPVAEFARAARSNDRGPLVLRNAATKRDFVSVHDVGRSLIRLATAERVDHAVVNVCSGIGLRYGDLALAMLERLGSERTIRSLGESGIMSVVGDPTRLALMTGLELEASTTLMAELALLAR